MYSKLLLKGIFLSLVLISFGCNPRPKEESYDPASLENFSAVYAELTAKIEARLKHDPRNQSLRLELAKFYYNFKDYQKTVELLKQADAKEAKIILAKALSRLKDYPLAIEIFEQLKPLPEDPEYLYLYGQVLEEKNLFPKAIKIYSQVKGSFTGQAQSRIKAIKASVGGEMSEAVKQVSEAAEDFLAQLKDDAAVYLLVDETTEITPENTSVSSVHVIEQVLAERGKELAEIDIGYDSTYQRIELEFARTITATGQVHNAGAENIRDVSRYLNFPLYSNSRAFIISMPSVEVGSFIEYRFKIYSAKLDSGDNFSFIYRLREKFPVFKAIFRLTVPEHKAVHFKFFNPEYAEDFNLQPALSQEGKVKIYTWAFERVKAIVPEYAMPPYAYINPAVLISSFSSWEEIYLWWQSLYQDKLKATPAMKEFLQKLIKDSSGNLDKAKKIYEFVAKNVRYVAIEYGEGGYEPHQAEEVFTNRYGDCKDQAILLVCLLREAGLAAYPVLIPTDSVYPVTADFPSINFNHAICAVEIEGRLIFMDPTSETTPFMSLPLADQNRPVAVFFDKEGKIITTDTIKENKVSYNMEIVINAEENAKVRRQVESSGFYAASYRWYLKYTHPAIIEEDIRAKMRQISSFSNLIDYQIKNSDDFDQKPLLVYNFSAEKFLNPAGNLRIVPVLNQLKLDYGFLSKEERRFPIDFEGLYEEAADIKIILPKNLKVKYLPPAFNLENPWFKLEVSYQQLKGEVNFYQIIRLKQRFVQVEEYPEFEKCLEDAIYRLREEIILEKSR